MTSTNGTHRPSALPSSLLLAAAGMVAWSVGVVITLTVLQEPFSIGWILIGFAIVPWVALSNELPQKDNYTRRAHSRRDS